MSNFNVKTEAQNFEDALLELDLETRLTEFRQFVLNMMDMLEQTEEEQEFWVPLFNVVDLLSKYPDNPATQAYRDKQQKDYESRVIP